MRLYDELSKWYRLLTPVAQYVDEAAAYWDAFASAATSTPATFLELGAGAGHNAFYLKKHFAGSIVLTDLSPRMLELSAAINNEPNVEHIAGDMRTLRLRRQFDCVLVHDAVSYMTNEADLRQAIETAFVHTRPGGVAIFAPDYFKETLDPSGSTDCGGSDSEDGHRGVRYLEWVFDPTPNDDTYLVDYALLLREGEKTIVEHERHVEGVFSKDTWKRLFSEVGYEARSAQRPRDDEGNQDEIFLLLRPQ